VYDETQTCNLGNGFDEIYRQSSDGHRRGARKAVKQGVVVKRASTREDWLAYYFAYEDSLRRWGKDASSHYGWPLFEEMFRRNSAYIGLWLAVFEARIVAGALCFYAPRHVVWWHGAALEDYFHVRPMNLLIYEIIKDACQQGYTWCDFNPSGGHEGVKSFKREFGALTLPTPVVCQESRLFRFVDLAWRVVTVQTGPRRQ